jgi:hypothetical protein
VPNRDFDPYRDVRQQPIAAVPDTRYRSDCVLFYTQCVQDATPASLPVRSAASLLLLYCRIETLEANERFGTRLGIPQLKEYKLSRTSRRATPFGISLAFYVHPGSGGR